MLTTKSQEPFANQSLEEMKKTRRMYTDQCNLIDIFVRCMHNKPSKPLNLTQLNEWKDQMQMLTKKTYDVLKDYMIKNDLIARKQKMGDHSCNVSISAC